MPMTDLPVFGSHLVAAFDVLQRPIWVFDPARFCSVFANRAGLVFMGFQSLAELECSECGDFFLWTPEVVADLSLHLRKGEGLHFDLDCWTCHDQVKTLDCLISGLSLENGQFGFLIEGMLTEQKLEGRRAYEVLSHLRSPISLYDQNGRLLYRNAAAAALYPSKRHCFVETFSSPEEGAKVFDRLRRGEAVEETTKVATAEGTRWHGIDARNLVGPQIGSAVYIVHERDVTDLKELEERLREREGQLEEVQDVARLGNWRYDIGSGIFYLSPALARIFELDHKVISYDMLLLRVHRGDRVLVANAFEQVALTGRVTEMTYRAELPSGNLQHIWSRWGMRKDRLGGEAQMIGVAKDVTEEMRSRERINFLALHDSVTGLPNRAHFVDMLAEAVSRYTLGGALILLDLDGFKEVNDTRGHAAGDAVLREVGRRLKALARPSETVARLGGDEFALILPGTTETEVLGHRARELLTVLTTPITVDGLQIFVGVSLGISRWPECGRVVDDIQRDADLALYSVKADGGKGWAQFSHQMREALDDQRWSRENLILALENNELMVFYQPLVHLKTLEHAGFEALVRWHHPERGMILPDQFIGVAEQAGLMWPLGAHVLVTATRQTVEWIAAGFDPGRLAVNLGAGQICNAGLVDFIGRVLKDTGLDPGQLDLEVTETVTLGQRSGNLIGTLKSLSGLGVGLVLDDFGTGHASLTHLRRLPVNQLKMDRTFVANIENDPSNAAIVRAMMGLGHSLGIPVVAEGIETREQLAILKGFDCMLGQGYLFSRPMPVNDATAWLERRQQGLPILD